MPSASPPLRLCFVGTHAPETGGYPSVSEVLGARLAEAGHDVTLVSRRRGRLARLMEIARTVRAGRKRFDVVIVDTFSTLALWYARIASRIASSVSGIGVPFTETAGNDSIDRSLAWLRSLSVWRA